MILGRAPGFAPGPAAVGPWRPVRLEHGWRLAVDELALRPRLEGDEGALAVTARLRGLDGIAPSAAELRLDGPSGSHAAPLALTPEGAAVTARGELRVPGVARWWPHTHGEPALHDVALAVSVDGAELSVAARPVGFRALQTGPDPAEEGLGLRLNDVEVFARGAVWTPPDPVGLAPDAADVRATLERARDAGMNMLRVVGTATYESEAFHDLCDELGLLVWQDLMFANLDYPLADDAFRATVTDEIRSVAAGLAGRPSVVVLCGNSEIEQQVGMLGLDPALGRGELFGELAPRLAADAELDAVYLPSSPCGGAFPFRPDRGVTHYFGVGAYRRPLTDARRAEPRFASECLAFANVGDGDTAVAPGSPGVPRDAGVDWDFADVRDFYLAELHGVDPVDLRFTDRERYLELSRSVTGEVMAEVMGEWRRPGSPCRGAIVLWLRDLAPGPGWGVLDHLGEPKAAYHHVRRALAPIAVWTTDEGLGGIRIHVANDGPEPLHARLRVALYAGGERLIAAGEEPIDVAAHGFAERDLEAVLGRFADASAAYRFGPAAHDAALVALEAPDGALLGRAVRFPAGPPSAPMDGDPGLQTSAVPEADGGWELTVSSRRLLYGVRIAGEGLWSSDDAFCLEPEGEHVVRLRRADGGEPGRLSLTALNLRGPVPVEVLT
jgi:beta-mannosidase